MSSFWLAVAICIGASLFYMFYSVKNELTMIDIEETNREGGRQTHFSLKSFLWPTLFLLLTPIGYSFLGGMDKQLAWNKAGQEFSKLVSGSSSIQKQGIQELVLSLRTAIDKDPKNGALWLILAESYVQLGMIDLADSAMERALRIEMRPDWLVANAQILMARASEEDISRSELMLKQALSIQADHQSALLTIGFIYLRQQRYSQAIQVWQVLVTMLERAGKNSDVIAKQIEFAKTELAKSQNENK